MLNHIRTISGTHQSSPRGPYPRLASSIFRWINSTREDKSLAQRHILSVRAQAVIQTPQPTLYTLSSSQSSAPWLPPCTLEICPSAWRWASGCCDRTASLLPSNLGSRTVVYNSPGQSFCSCLFSRPESQEVSFLSWRPKYTLSSKPVLFVSVL